MKDETKSPSENPVQKKKQCRPIKICERDGCTKPTLSIAMVCKTHFKPPNVKRFRWTPPATALQTLHSIPELLRVCDLSEVTEEQITHGKEISTKDEQSKPYSAHCPKKKKEDKQKTKVCLICPKKFAYKSKLNHNTQTGGKLYTCDKCQKKFTRKFNLTVHERTHTGYKPFKCNECPGFFASRYTLNRHKRVHTGEKAYKCDECQKVFSQKNNLAIHKRTHTKEKPYKCDECQKGFSQKINLANHRRTHNGYKPFECPQCRKVFARKITLVYHKRTHDGKKPYQCAECGQRFTQPGTLWRHSLYHEKSQSYQVVCPYDSYTETKGEGLPCGTRFKNSRNLDYHVQRSHTAEGLHQRLETENQLARFLDQEGIAYDRDFQNVVAHGRCPGLKEYFQGQYSRPDFHLYEMQAQTKLVVLIGNDEFAHRRYTCEADRMLKIASALGSTDEFHNVPLLYIRFNPHFFETDGVLFDPPLSARFECLLGLLRKVERGELELRNPTGLNVVYLYYPTVEGQPIILQDDPDDVENREFTMVVRTCVIDW